MAKITETVKVLLIVNIIFFIGAGMIGDEAIRLFALWFPENPHFQVWQLATHMFMHANFMHIAFNMFALYMFGSLLEHYLGQKRFLFLYFSSGLGAAGLQILFSYIGFNDAFQAYLDAGISPDQVQQLIQSAMDTGKYLVYPSVDPSVTHDLLGSYITPMVGASGAIFGVLAAFALIYPNLPLYIMFIPVPIKSKYLIGGYFLINVFSAVTGVAVLGPSNTAHWAHIGGAIIGFITMWAWKKAEVNQNRWN